MTRATELQISVTTYESRLARLRLDHLRNQVAIRQVEDHLDRLRRELRETEAQ
jgi:hypothetical protein